MIIPILAIALIAIQHAYGDDVGLLVFSSGKRPQSVSLRIIISDMSTRFLVNVSCPTLIELPISPNRDCLLLPGSGWHRGHQDADRLIARIAELDVCPWRNGQTGSRAKPGDHILVSETAPYLSLA